MAPSFHGGNSDHHLSTDKRPKPREPLAHRTAYAALRHGHQPYPETKRERGRP